MVAIWFSLCSFLTVLAGKTVNCLSDIQTAVKVLNIGSSKPGLHKIALEIFQFCYEIKMLLPEWVPRNLNTQIGR